VVAWDPSVGAQVSALGGDRFLWSRDVAGEAYAHEQLEMHAACAKLEDAFGHTPAPEEASAASAAARKVEHLGAGVIVQRGVHAIDADSRLQSRTITRLEQRHMAQLAIAAASDPTSKPKVVVIGQPGIGKTRGGLAFTLQLLLAEGKAVMRVGYKANTVHLFLPRQDQSGYTVFISEAHQWSGSLLAQAIDMYVLMDPPESGPYRDGASCRVIKYASNNVKHYHNLTKDGSLLVTATPTEQEVLAMLPELWTEASALPNQQLDTLEERRAEVRKRAQLVGWAPRYVFSGVRFRERLEAMVEQANGLVRGLEGRPTTLLSLVLGESTTAVHHKSSVSSHIFSVEPECPGPVGAWQSRCNAQVKLMDVAALVLCKQLQKELRAFSVEDAFVFEQFVQECLELGLDASPRLPRSRWLPAPFSFSESSAAMIRLMRTQQDGSSGPVYLRTSAGFPVVDFATTSTGRDGAHGGGEVVVHEWWNAKVGGGRPEVGSSAFMRLLNDLGLVDSSGVWIGAERRVKFKLTMVCSSSKAATAKVRLKDSHRTVQKRGVGDFARAKVLFDEYVEATCVDVATWKGRWAELRESRMEAVESLLSEYTTALQQRKATTTTAGVRTAGARLPPP
jgi:hypothetical protein